ncbi:MAG: hypothetical protein ACYTFM_08480 [Planctomycetota bacterium]
MKSTIITLITILFFSSLAFAASADQAETEESARLRSLLPLTRPKPKNLFCKTWTPSSSKSTSSKLKLSNRENK